MEIDPQVDSDEMFGDFVSNENSGLKNFSKRY